MTTKTRFRDSAWLPWAKRILGFLFIAIVLTLLVRYARNVDWQEVKNSLLALPRHVLLLALVVAAGAHVVYSMLELLGRHYVGHGLSKKKVMQVGLTCFAFNLNLGSLVGGVGLRYRLYSRLGLRAGQITRVLSMSMLSNWLGYVLLAGLVFTMAPLELPPDWKLDSEALRLLGVALLAVCLSYLGLSAFARKRSYKVRGHVLEVPNLRMAGAQLAISCTHWMLTAAVPWVLLQGQVSYPTVLAVLLVAAIAGVITHVPGGLGVIEAVFVALLSHRIPEAHLLGALLAYRAVYYLVPLMVGALLYLKVEVKAGQPAPSA